MLGARLLAKAQHATVLAVELGDPELQLGAHDRHRRQSGVGVVEGQQRLQIDVGEAVGVGEAEPLAAEMRAEQLNAPARWGVESGVDAAHLHPRRPIARGGKALDQIPL